MIRAHDYQPPLDLRNKLTLSVYLEACRNTIQLAREERLPHAKDAQLREAQRLLEQPMFSLLPPDEQAHLQLTYAEAYVANMRAG